MNDLQIVRLENTDISGWDFAMLKAELQSRLDSYAGLVYTDETIKSAKTDHTTLNNVIFSVRFLLGLHFLCQTNTGFCQLSF